MRMQFSLGHVVMLELDYWENCGSLRRKGKGIVMLVHCSFPYLIVSLCYWYTHAMLGAAGSCFFYFAVRQIKELDFHREA